MRGEVWPVWIIYSNLILGNFTWPSTYEYTINIFWRARLGLGSDMRENLYTIQI